MPEGSGIGVWDDIDVPYSLRDSPGLMRLGLYLVSGNDLIRGVKDHHQDIQLCLSCVALHGMRTVSDRLPVLSNLQNCIQ